MSTHNVLLLMSDQHSPYIMGCYGNDHASTPNLDALAARGTVFDAAYTPSPICVPARASLATGRFAHDTGNWDNAAPFTGTEAASWATRLGENGIPVTTFGKLHYRAPEDPTGFKNQVLPLHVKNGVGDLTQLLRGEQPPTPGLRAMVEQAGPGESDYTRYDRDVAVAAAEWIVQQPSSGQPWCAVVSLVSPHYPLIAPVEYYERFIKEDLPPRPGSDPRQWDHHPAPSEYRSKSCLDEPLDPETVRRATAAYYALVAFMDAQMGRVLKALKDSGQTENTTVIYLSDHGESLGSHGFWFKSTLHETAVRVPMIIADAAVKGRRRCTTPASLVDVFPTMLEQFGVPLSPEDKGIRGTSLRRLAREPEDPERQVFAEYHAVHSSSASFALRRGRWKLHHHVGHPSRLFNLVTDPDELHDLAGKPEFAPVLAQLEEDLSGIVPPHELDVTVKKDQAERMERAGGREAVLATQFAAPYTPVPAARA
ncbi:sulfatase-like hydrolase/transferase [Arthrobacter mangrovi]|uniref:Sulfatase n=1 Tax=Arthrobacter mangrovi TaxID=2966350 RepID=A0ABQ5MZZ8_9MICC|nr:sulfatase-like hydrolase/transferase [Arthrobacter mangrovi]GLB69499.1 sulfatase [Arthrobacter mangrovi]